MRKTCFEAVIGLPANLFLWHVGIPACILIFNRAKGDNRDVLFIDASSQYAQGKNQNCLREEDIEHIVNTYKAFKEESPREGEEGREIEAKYAYRATQAEIKETILTPTFHAMWTPLRKKNLWTFPQRWRRSLTSRPNWPR
ncbi:MAG: N-6 DNA methylase [Bacteroidia bacterium]